MRAQASAPGRMPADACDWTATREKQEEEGSLFLLG